MSSRLKINLPMSRYSRGFTLIELLVVLVIIGILASFVTLSIGDGGKSQYLELETRRLGSLLALAHQEAILKAKEFGVQFTETGYQFFTLAGTQWQALAQDSVLRARQLPAGMRLAVVVEGEDLALQALDNAPQVLLMSSGESTPCEIRFFYDVAPQTDYVLQLDGLGAVDISN